MDNETETQDIDDLIAVLDAKPGKVGKKSKKTDDPEFLRAQMYRGHDIGFVRTIEEWDDLMAKCVAAGGIVGFDIETFGKDPFKHRIHGFSISWEKGCGRYIFWELIEQNREKCARDLMKLR